VTESDSNPIEPILEVRGLKTYFYLNQGIIRAVDGVDLDVYPGRTLGIVGESGCGKSVTAQSIMRIVPEPPARIVGGSIIYHKDGEPLDISSQKWDSASLRRIRGAEIGYIFQEPMSSLSPVHTIGSQITETIRLHNTIGKQEAWDRGIELLEHVKIPRPQEVMRDYIHQLSGGMRQRAMIAQALSCKPRILIADEPTTALDVTMQAQILRLIRDLQRELGMAVILITHDMGVIAQTADDVTVVYMGKVVESGSVFQIFDTPFHPYTKALFNSIPRLDRDDPPEAITGSVPGSFAKLRGCAFVNRCSDAMDRCRTVEPAVTTMAEGHTVRCHLFTDADEQTSEAVPE
jgi:oligopeptide/dipeptide ABC transporter ATP-binding protein